MAAVTEQIKVPELRFHEFSMGWEEKRLGLLFDFHRGSVLSKADLSAGGRKKCIHYGELFTIYREVINHVKSRTDASGIESLQGDILMPTSDVTPKGLATASCIQEDGVILGGDMNILRSKSSIDSVFFSYRINFSSKEIMKLVTGTTIKHIYSKDLKGLTLFTPNLQEQQKIADFLKAVDERIAKLKRKKKLLEEYKRGMIQKLFSQEIRFKDEDGNKFPDWIETRFGKVLDFFSTNSLSRKELSPSGIGPQVIHYGDIHVKYPSTLDLNQTDIPSACKDFVKGEACEVGDLLIADASEDYLDIGKATEIIRLGNKPTLGGLHVIHSRPKPNIFASGFLAYLFKCRSCRLELMRRANGASVLGLSSKQICQICLRFPCLSEQQKIANCLTGIDDKITTVANQIDKAAEFKRGLLQKMFV